MQACIDASVRGNLCLHADGNSKELRAACCRVVLVSGNDDAADLELYGGDPDVLSGIVLYYGGFRT